MKRTTAAFMAITLGLAACGGDDAADPADGGADDAPAEPADERAGEDGDGGDDAAVDPPADEEPASDDADERRTDDGAAEDEPDEMDDATGSGGIDSIDDIPERCRELMADFLRDIEPIVEPIDWRSASLTEFESIADQFEELADSYDAEAETRECDDLDVADEGSFDLLIEFAGDVAPGTVSFFQFLENIGSAVAPDEGAGGAGGESGAALETCDDAIAALEELMNEYDAFTDIPVEELLRFTSLGTIMMTCTPEQLEVLNSAEFEDFLNS